MAIEEVDDSDDNSLGNEFMDATLLIDEEIDSIENPSTREFEINHKFLQGSWANLAENEGNNEELLDVDSIPQSVPGFTMVRAKDRKNKLKSRSSYGTKSKVIQSKHLQLFEFIGTLGVLSISPLNFLLKYRF